MKPTVLSLLVIGAALAPISAHAQAHADRVMVAPADVKWVDLPSIPGVQIAVLLGKLDQPGPFVVRAKYPANGMVAPHTHPVTERLTVISGTFHVGMGETFDRARTKAYPAGSFLVTPPGIAHFGWVEGETILQVHGVGPWGINFIKAEAAKK